MGRKSMKSYSFLMEAGYHDYNEEIENRIKANKEMEHRKKVNIRKDQDNIFSRDWF